MAGPLVSPRPRSGRDPDDLGAGGNRPEAHGAQDKAVVRRLELLDGLAEDVHDLRNWLTSFDLIGDIDGEAKTAASTSMNDAEIE